jgi:hypothetical protein
VDASTPAEFNRDAAIALTTLAQDVISDPERRRAFAEQPHRTADEFGVDLRVLPDPVVDTLTKLSDDELRLLAELNQTLIGQGLYVEFDGMATCIFL